MTKETGGSAFPFSGLTEINGSVVRIIPENGMTLRDWFAGMALQGMLAGMNSQSHEKMAKAAYLLADAMLQESKQ